MYDNKTKIILIITKGDYTMGNILSVLKQIFTGKEDCSMRVGISEFKIKTEPVKRIKKAIIKRNAPQELRLSEIMRGAY